MPRHVLILGALALLLASPAVAEAEEGMCVLEAPAPPARQLEVGYSVGVDAVRDAAPSRAARDDDAPARNDILWCSNTSDDPRCMPMQGAPDVPHLSFSGPLLCLAHPAPNPAPPAISTVGFHVDAERPRPGVRARLERPPRA